MRRQPSTKVASAAVILLPLDQGPPEIGDRAGGPGQDGYRRGEACRRQVERALM
jgi:hypothetical protein